MAENTEKMDMSKVKLYLAETFGTTIIGEGNLPTVELSNELRKLQLFVNKLVTAHDAVADETDASRRLVGKRGRKSGEVSRPKSAADIVKALS